MKHNWEYKPFKQLSDILYGCPFESEFFNSESKGMPLIRIRDVKPGFTSTYFNGAYSNEYLIKKGDYLIGMDGEFNIAPWQSEDALLNQRVCRVKSLNESIIISDFIYYFLGKELKNIEAQTSFVTVKHLSAKVLNAISTPVPPMEVQQQIVAELDKINKVIDDCRELLRNLDALAQSLFYDYFGDPATNPKGWTLKTLGTISTVLGGSTPKTNIAEYWNGDLCWITPAELNGEKYIFNTERHISELGRASAGLLLFPKNTVLLTSRAPIGKVAIAKAPMYCNQGFKNLICDEKQVHFQYVFFFLSLITDVLNEKGSGATFKEISKRVTESISIPVPPLELQEKFAERVEQIDAQKKAVEETIANLQTLLDSRMDYWFN